MTTIGKVLPFRITSITDTVVREHLDMLRRNMAEDVFANFDGKFFILTFTSNATHLVPHGLFFIPTDVVQTSLIGGALTWNFASFTDTTLSVTTSGITDTLTVRAFVGCYGGD